MFDDFATPYEIAEATSGLSVVNRALYVVDIESGEKSKVLSRAEVGSPTAHGNRLLMYGYNEEGRHSWFVMDDDGTVRSWFPALSDSFSYRFLTWSTDGGLIAYISETTVGELEDELKMIDATTGVDIPLEAKPELYVDNFLWSPDSGHIAYAGIEGRSNISEIHIVRHDLSRGFLEAIPKWLKGV